MRILPILAALFFVASSAFGDDATNYFNSARAKFNKGDMDGAIADYTKAIELKPNELVYYNRGKPDSGDLF